jgi:predicted nucleic acid-binding protein
MRLLISDANILIDLEEGQLIEQLFRLSYEFRVPDLLFYDELETSHAHLRDKGLKLGELTPASIEYGMRLVQKYPKPSRNDCFALALAVQENCPLLTGDKDLRDAAKQENAEVKGTLWLMERMIEQKIISIAQAWQAYALMQQAGRRLPWKEAEKRLHQIENREE